MSTNCNDSFSPSAGKPRLFIEYLKRRGIYLDIMGDFLPLTEDDLSLAHDPEYVHNVMNLKSSNGFGNKSFEIAESLLFTTGSFYAAAEWAIKHKENTFSPTSGFHHAGYFRGGGFCTFNGLMIAALKLKQNGLIKTLGIIDCDQHYGNGTDDIMIRKKVDWVLHYSFGNLNLCKDTSGRWLSSFAIELQKFSDFDIVFYQAGVDCHIDDPLGGSLTTTQMMRRDELVFRTFHNFGIPVTWNLAGGYQTPVHKMLDLHKTTYEIALSFTRRLNG
jgi:acetoin utilization deacetylase AcuC-like enzyme